MSQENPYHLTADQIEEPPTQFSGMLRHLGPGFILSASIVGSGELIATTALGAEGGFIVLWVVLVSCLIKVAVQLEFGKHTIYSGLTTFQAFNTLPGPKFGKGSWTTWLWLVLMIPKPLQLAGILTAFAAILQLALPDALEKTAWCFVVAPLVSALVFFGKYKLLEKLSIGMIGLFAVFTMVCVVALQFTADYSFGWAEIGSGLTLQLPIAVLGVAIAAFGITGVGGDEVLMYNYWLLEKGYAAKTGPRDDSDDWNRRAKGWIRVMTWDAVLSMVVYTVMTAAFFILGAAVTHKTEGKLEGATLIEDLSAMYTSSVGPWAESVFLIGAAVVLFSTLFSALAGWARMFADGFGGLGFIDFENLTSRNRMIGILVWGFPLFWATLTIFWKNPVIMVLVGGAVTTLILLLVVYAVLVFHFHRVPAALRPGRPYVVTFFVSVLAIFILAGTTVYSKVNDYQEKTKKAASEVQK